MNDSSEIPIYCFISGKLIPPARVEALREMGIPEEEMTHIEHSQTRKPQGIYFGEQGSGILKIVRRVDDNSVRKVFDDNEEIEEEDND